MTGHDYPADEFDAAASGVVPQGVHRAPRSRLRRALPFVVVLITFPALAVAAVTLISGEGPTLDLPSFTEEDPTPDPAPDAGATEAPADPGGPADPAATAAPAPPAEEPAPAPEPVTPDLAQVIEVYNATSRSGLAAGAAERVEGAGFTEVLTGNWQGTDPDGSVVYYASEAEAVTAQAVAAELGITDVQESPDQAGEGVVVVLGADYSG